MRQTYPDIGPRSQPEIWETFQNVENNRQQYV